MKLTVKLPNFSMTRGKIPSVGGGGGVARARLRKNLRALFAWGGLGLAFLLIFGWLALPTRAIAWRIEHEAKKAGIVLDVGDVSIRPWGSAVLHEVAWTYEPSRPGVVPGKFYIDRVEADVSLFSLLLFGELDIDVEAELGGEDEDAGRLTANYHKEDDVTHYKFTIEDVPLYALPKAQQSLNAPLRGIFALDAELNLPDHEFEKAEGHIEITCAACVVGDEQTKLFVPGATKALKNGVTIPEVDLGTLTGRMTVTDGIAKTDGPIETESNDVWVKIEGEIELADPFATSRFFMTLKFYLSESLQNRSERMKLLIQTANPKTLLDPPEKGLGFKLEGPVGKPRFIGIKAKSRLVSRADKRAAYRDRVQQRRKGRGSKKKKKPSDRPGSAGRGSRGDADNDKDREPLDIKPIDKPALPPPREDPEESPSEPEPEETPVEPEEAEEVSDDEEEQGGDGEGDGDGDEEEVVEEEGGDEEVVEEEGGEEEVVIEDEGGEDEGGEQEEE